MSKALQVQVHSENYYEEDNIPFVDEKRPKECGQVTSIPSPIIHKVHCDVSPFFFVYYEHHPCHIILDTGATSSLVSKSFIRLCNIKVHATPQSARTIDKSPLHVH